MSLIRFQNVTMAYENRVVLREVYFRLWAGERVGLIGRNGTGKTTLLKLILEQLEPSLDRLNARPRLRSATSHNSPSLMIAAPFRRF